MLIKFLILFIIGVIIYLVPILIVSKSTLYMPKFFKKLPKKDFFKRGKYIIAVGHDVPFGIGMKTIYAKEYNGFYGIAYIKARLLALAEDNRTRGDECGIYYECHLMKEN